MSKMSKKVSVLALAFVAFVTFAVSFFFVSPVKASVSDDVISILSTAEVRLDTVDDDEDKTGIRFTINVNKEKYTALTAVGGEYEGYTASLGAAIIPTKYLNGADFDASKISYDDKAVLHIPLVNKVEEIVNVGSESQFTKQTYNAVVKDIPAVNYEVELSAKGYIKLTAEGQEDVYIQTADVASRSIGQVITGFYTETDPDYAPDATEKAALSSLIETGVKTSLAAKLPDGYVADFSSSSYSALVEEMQPANYNETFSASVTEFQGLDVLEVKMLTNSTTNGGFILNLPKAVGANKVQVKLYATCDNAMGIKFCSPDDGATGISENFATQVSAKWTIITLDYSEITNTNQLHVHAYTGAPYENITVYVAFARIEMPMNPTEFYLADYSNYSYEATALPLTAGPSTRGVNATYLDEFNGEEGVLKVVPKADSTNNTYWAFKLKLPKAATANKVEIRMYVEYAGSCGMIFGNPDTSGATSGDKLGSQSWGVTKDAWATYVIDYSQYTTKDVVEVVLWGNATDQATYYISWVKCVDLAFGLEEGYLADYSNAYYELTITTTQYGSLSKVTYMEEFANEKDVLKIDLVSGAGGQFKIVFDLPKNIGQNKVKIKIYDAFTGGQGDISFYYPGTNTAIQEGTLSGGKNNQWQEYTIDYTAQADTNKVVLYSYASAQGKEVTFYVSYVMIAE